MISGVYTLNVMKITVDNIVIHNPCLVFLSKPKFTIIIATQGAIVVFVTGVHVAVLVNTIIWNKVWITNRTQDIWGGGGGGGCKYSSIHKHQR